MTRFISSFWFLFCTITHGGDVDCLAWHSCYGQTKNCADYSNGQKCVVTCGGSLNDNEACANAIINCEAGVPCEVC